MSADVRSIDALRDWQANLTTYGELLAEAMAGVELELRRGFEWINEQQSQWQRAVRIHEEEVVQAKAELSARKFTTWDGREPDTTVQEKNLRMAKARLEHAEDQVARCRSWSAKLPKLIEEVYRGPAHRLATFLEVDLPNGLASLSRKASSLESYAGIRPDYAPAPPTSTAPHAPKSPASNDQSEGGTP